MPPPFDEWLAAATANKRKAINIEDSKPPAKRQHMREPKKNVSGKEEKKAKTDEKPATSIRKIVTIKKETDGEYSFWN
jgi:hypothetical protein